MWACPVSMAGNWLSGPGAETGLKVLFITGYAEDATFGQMATEEGAQMLPKPFGVNDLLTHVDALLRR